MKRIIAQSLSFAYEPGLIPANEDVPLDLDAPNPRKINVIGVASLESAVAELPDLVNNIKTLQEDGLNNISFEVNHDTLEHLLACFFICENEKPVKKQKTYNNRNKNEKNNLINRHFVSFYILTLSRNVQSAV